MKKIQVNGVTLAYEEIGEGNDFIIASQNHFSPNHYARLLAQPPYNYHVFFVVMRGYGESTHIYSQEPQDFTKLWSEDVIAFAKAMGIEKFFYTGHSHGNYPGWYMCFHKPEILRGFISCDGILQFHMPHTGGAPEKAPAFDISKLLGNEEEIRKLVSREDSFTQNLQRLKRRRENQADSLNRWMTMQPEEFLINNENFAVTDAASEEELYELVSHIAVPVLLINGGIDAVSTIEEAVQIGKLIPGAKLVMYQNIGHGGLYEIPEQIAADIDLFVRSRENYIL